MEALALSAPCRIVLRARNMKMTDRLPRSVHRNPFMPGHFENSFASQQPVHRQRHRIIELLVEESILFLVTLLQNCKVVHSTCCYANLSQFNFLFGNYGKNIRILTLMIGNGNFDSHDRYVEFVSL